MAQDKSTYLRNAIYNAIFRNISFQGPAVVYCSLHTGDPGLTGVNEVAGNAYARTGIVMGAPVAGAGASTNTVTFPAPNPADWGTISWIGFWDALNAGNFLGKSPLTNAIITSIGVPVVLPSNNVLWSEL